MRFPTAVESLPAEVAAATPVITPVEVLSVAPVWLLRTPTATEAKPVPEEKLERPKVTELIAEALFPYPEAEEPVPEAVLLIPKAEERAYPEAVLSRPNATE